MGLYFWLKALHIIAVISWMAGLLYLPRLFVYHCGVRKDGEAAAQFIVMERKLLKYIMNPAMIASWLFGIAILVTNPYLLGMGWMHAKLTLVVLMSGYHGFLSASRKKFAAGQYVKTGKFWRWMNEVPTVLMIVIVILAVGKPF